MHSNGTRNYNLLEEEYYLDRYYLDYRRQCIVKNLDTTFLAPEMYNEVVVNEELAGSYKYTYADQEDRRLDFMFTMEQVQYTPGGYDLMMDEHCKRHNFIPERIVDKLLYISQQQFDEAYQGGW